MMYDTMQSIINTVELTYKLLVPILLFIILTCHSTVLVSSEYHLHSMIAVLQAHAEHIPGSSGTSSLEASDYGT